MPSLAYARSPNALPLRCCFPHDTLYLRYDAHNPIFARSVFCGALSFSFRSRIRDSETAALYAARTCKPSDPHFARDDVQTRRRLSHRAQSARSGAHFRHAFFIRVRLFRSGFVRFRLCDAPALRALSQNEAHVEYRLESRRRACEQCGTGCRCPRDDFRHSNALHRSASFFYRPRDRTRTRHFCEYFLREIVVV